MVCALGEGVLDSIFGLMGIVAGGFFYAQYYPFFKKIRVIGSHGKISLDQVLHVNHWVIIIIFVVLMVGFCLLFEKLEKKY